MNMADFYKKTTSYWQAVIRAGVPIIFLYRVIHYAIFLIEGGSSAGIHCPWKFAMVVDPITIFVLSTLWWSLCVQALEEPVVRRLQAICRMTGRRKNSFQMAGGAPYRSR